MIIKEYEGSPFLNECNLFYSNLWLDVLKECYGFRFKMVIDSVENSCKPLLLYAEICDVFGKRIVSLPFSDYTEPFVRSSKQLKDALCFLKKEYPDQSLLFRLYGEWDISDSLEFVNVRKAFCHRISLREGKEKAWQRTGRHFKKGVRKAREYGLNVEQCNSENGVTIFYDMLTKLRRQKFKILPQSKAFYMLLWKHFIEKGHGNIWIAFHDEKPIGTAIVLHSGNMMFDKIGVSDQEYLRMRPNNLLLWEIMRYGIENGFAYLDMGLTGHDYEGLLRFKDSLGGQCAPINFYKYDPISFDKAREREIKKLLGVFTDFLIESDLPDSKLQEASEFLYRYFC